MSDSENKNTNPIKPLTTGLAVGAALGAAAVVLSDKKNQEKVKRALMKVREWAGDTATNLSNSSEDVVADTKETMTDVADDVQKTVKKKKASTTVRREVN